MQGQFLERGWLEMELGFIAGALYLVQAATGYQWYQELALTLARCEIETCIAHVNAVSDEVEHKAQKGSCYVFLGTEEDEREKFRMVTGEYGRTFQALEDVIA